MHKNCTIIIVTYNSSHLIKFCLQNINIDQYKVILVDNASSDNTLEIISSNFPQIQIIKNNKNIGYGRANNIALKQVKTDFSLLLNVDAVIDQKNIDNIINLMQQNQQIAIAGPMVYSGQLQDNKIINQTKCTKNRYHNQKCLEDKNFYFSGFVTGAAMFLNMKIMSKIGFFDEGFFLYCEDNELCKRSLQKKYKVVVIKNSKFCHLSCKSSISTADESYRICWHKLGWSKAYYTQKVWGVTIAKLKSIRMILKFSFLCLKEMAINNKISTQNKSALQGCLAYLIGLGAFDKNDNPRG